MAIRVIAAHAGNVGGLDGGGPARGTIRAWALLASTVLAGGCGSGGSSAPVAQQATSGTSQVTMVIGSTANDRLAEYDVNFQSITLTSRSGTDVTVLGASQNAEFIHVNGSTEPMLTVAVPQDVYTAATVVINSASMTCLSLDSAGGVATNIFAYNGLPPGNVTVTLPQPITISGASVGLSLNMQVSQSASFSNCAGGTGSTFSFTPTFALSAFSLPATTTTSASVLRTLDGKVTALDAAAGSLQLALAPESASAVPIVVRVGSGAVNQGFAGLAALANGQFVQVDGSMQSDGSVLASRIALADPVAVDVQEGPILLVHSASPTLAMYPLMEQGQDGRIDVEIFDFSGASFHVDGRFTNLSTLPFAPSFTAANMVAGQNVYISSPVFNYIAPPDYTGVATTITLEPQTIDGTIVATATSGAFTVYTVQLAAYDLFPALAVQPDQTTLLTQPATVQVYVDAGTQQMGSAPPANGGTARFFGLVFNDNGTLRMDCSRIDDGVAP
jgi:hypothetical protein